MDVGRYLVEAHLKEGRSVASLARDHGLHRSWIYKLLARYEREGEAGLAPRSRRPRTSPTAEPRARGANRRDPPRALRGVTAQRVLAVRHDALGLGGRQGHRDRELH